MEFHNSHLPVLLLGGVSSGVRSACGKDGGVVRCGWGGPLGAVVLGPGRCVVEWMGVGSGGEGLEGGEEDEE